MLPYIAIDDYMCLMTYCFSTFLLFDELDILHSHFHKTVRCLIHCVAQYRVFQLFFHFGNIYDTTIGKFLELFILDIGTVHSHHVAFAECRRFEHEGIVDGSRGKLYIRRYSLVGMDDGMHLDTTFLFASPRMPSHALEQQVGEKGDGRGVDDLKPLHPFGCLAAAAVRGKYIAIGGRSRYMASNIASECLLLAAASVLRPILKVTKMRQHAGLGKQ